MKILVVTTKSPLPLFEGRALRTYNLIRQIALHHQVHLLSFIQTKEELESIEQMKSACAVVEYERLYFEASPAPLLADAALELFSRAPLQAIKYRSARLRARMRRLQLRHAYDLVLLDMLHLADYMDLFPRTPVVLGEHNVEYVILKRRAENEVRWLRRLYLRYQCVKLKRFEARACARAAHVIAVSEIDARLLRELSPSARITVVPNGVDTGFFANSASPMRPGSLVYVGGFTWFPNQDAIQYFCDQILPLMVGQVPGLELAVIGKNPDSAAARKIAANPHVRLAGLVQDIRPHVAAASVYIVPLRIGGGTRLKILDALSMSKAIVSTSVGCEGLEVEDGRNILIADTPERFAAAVVRLLKDPDLARELGRQGRMLAERRYDWSVLAAGLLQVCAEAVKGGAMPPPGIAGPAVQSDQPRQR